MDTMQGVAARIVPCSFWVSKKNSREHARVTELVTWRTCPDSVMFVVLGESGDHELLIKDFLDRFDRVAEDDEGLGMSLLCETDVARSRRCGSGS